MKKKTTDFYCEEILTEKIQVDKVAETMAFLAFHHTRPSYPVHIVVIPKAHRESLEDIDEVEGDDEFIVSMMRVVKAIATEVKTEHGKCRIITNLGDYQESKHLHWHIVSGDRL